MVSARHLKWIAIGYLVKTVLIGVAWLAVPDLPQRAREGLDRSWRRILAVAGASEEAETRTSDAPTR